jgi:glycosyltransferase involved in cell wall biosynthesis
MARALIAAGHSVTMVCGSYGAGKTGLTTPFFRGKRRGLVDGIDVLEYELGYSNRDGFLRRTLTFAKFAARSLSAVFTERYDVLFATSTPLTAAVPGILGRWLKGARFVFEVRDLWPELPREMGVIKNPIVLMLMDWLEWMAYRSAHRLIALSPGIARGIERRGVAPDRIAMIPNGCDVSLFSEYSQPWRPEGVEPTDLLAVFAGTHGQANGLSAVLDAAAVLKRRQRDDIKILLIGDGQLKDSLRERAKREQLTNIVFHSPVNKAKLAELMAATDVGLQILANVRAFYDGTSPNKFFDYIAAGVPPLINYPGWLAEFVAAEQCGLVVPPEQPDALAAALERAARDRGELLLMGKRAKALALAQFDRRALAKQFVSWLQTAAA